MPDWFDDCAQFADGDDFYLAAFWELSSCRQNGMSQGEIPWNVAKEYAVFHELEHDVARAFIQVIRAMDHVYLEDMAEESRRNREAEEARTARAKESNGG